MKSLQRLGPERVALCTLLAHTKITGIGLCYITASNFLIGLLFVLIHNRTLLGLHRIILFIQAIRIEEGAVRRTAKNADEGSVAKGSKVRPSLIFIIDLVLCDL